jgi:hypothetical protein
MDRQIFIHLPHPKGSITAYNIDHIVSVERRPADCEIYDIQVVIVNMAHGLAPAELVKEDARKFWRDFTTWTSRLRVCFRTIARSASTA